jgi:hypothetical protein
LPGTRFAVNSRRYDLSCIRALQLPLIDSNEFNKNAIPVTAICSPHLNSLVAVDAAVRHIAHHIKADVVILDPADLATGQQGVFGAGS